MKKRLEISTFNYLGSVDIEVMLSLRTAVALVGSSTFERVFFLALFLSCALSYLSRGFGS